jgi:hypothetical protein
MAFLHVRSFELGFMLAEIFRTIAIDKVLKPSIERELIAVEQRFERLKEDIVSSRVTDCTAVMLIVTEVFSELTDLRNSYESDQ